MTARAISSGLLTFRPSEFAPDEELGHGVIRASGDAKPYSGLDEVSALPAELHDRPDLMGLSGQAGDVPAVSELGEVFDAQTPGICAKR